MTARINSDLKRFNYVVNETCALYHIAAQKIGISDSVLNILYTVCCEGGRVYLSQIARANGMSKQTINSAIRKLEKDDIVFLEKGEGRNLYVCLTENGKIFADKNIMPIINAETEVLSSWDESEIQELIRLSEKFRSGLAEKIENLHI